MIRVRLYSFTLSLPLVLVIAGVLVSFIDDASLSIGLNAGTILFASGVVLQILFSLMFACPRCGKSPYAIGPFIGPFSLAGKPIPDLRCSKCGYHLAGTSELSGSAGSETSMPPTRLDQPDGQRGSRS